MTRKDYIKTANILKSFVDEIPQITYEDLVNEFAEWFKSDNENFDFARFEKACGIDEIGLISTGLSTRQLCD
jgi:hypothetical protein